MRQRSRSRFVSLSLLLAGLTGPATAVTRSLAAEYRVASADAIGRLAGSVQPGEALST